MFIGNLTGFDGSLIFIAFYKLGNKKMLHNAVLLVFTFDV